MTGRARKTRNKEENDAGNEEAYRNRTLPEPEVYDGEQRKRERPQMTRIIDATVDREVQEQDVLAAILLLLAGIHVRRTHTYLFASNTSVSVFGLFLTRLQSTAQIRLPGGSVPGGDR